MASNVLFKGIFGQAYSQYPCVSKTCLYQPRCPVATPLGDILSLMEEARAQRREALASYLPLQKLFSA